jgi:hypothetical protein
MITREEGRILVESYLASTLPAVEDGPRVVSEEHTKDYPGCWVFFWVRKKYLETKDPQLRIGGNYPVIVDKTDGALYATGFRPVEEYVEIFNTGKSKLKRLSSS